MPKRQYSRNYEVFTEEYPNIFPKFPIKFVKRFYSWHSYLISVKSSILLLLFAADGGSISSETSTAVFNHCDTY